MLNSLPLPTAPRPSGTLLDVDRAVADLRRGQLVVLCGHGEALLVHAAEAVTGESLARAAALAAAYPKLAITARRAAVLGLAEPPRPGAREVRVLASAELDPLFLRDLADPNAGPPRARAPLAVSAASAGSAAAAAVELMKLARLFPAAVVVELGRDPAALASREGLMLVEADDVLAYQSTAARTLRRVAAARVPLADAEHTTIVAFRPADGGVEHLAIVVGEPAAAAPVLTRIHSECFTGDLLRSLKCDCGDQLRGAIAEIARAGGGLLLYLAQEGRGIGLVNKLRAYQLQDKGFDTVDANEQLGFDGDERIYLPAAEMLRQLGFAAVRLMTNNPDKVAALESCGIAVAERVPHVFPANGHNEKYLRTKAARSGHYL